MKELFSIPWDLVTKISTDLKLDPKFIGAIVKVESNGNSATVRYEPNYKYLYFPDKYAALVFVTVDTETILQKCSWGLMQVMGGVARELGFTELIPRLCEPALGLEFGCRKIRALMEKYGNNNLSDLAAAYNAGSVRKSNKITYDNERYVDSVMNYYRMLQ